MKRRSSATTVTAAVAVVVVVTAALSDAVTIAPRHCHGQIRHLHLAVGPDPTTSMTVSFASAWAFPDRPAPIAGVHYGTSPDHLDQFAPEQEYPLTYQQDGRDGMHQKPGQYYYAPYQHHITLEGLESDTTYYYVPVLGTREHYEEDPMSLQSKKPFPHAENILAENKIIKDAEDLQEGENESTRRVLEMKMEVDTTPRFDHTGRRLAPPPYDPTGHDCIDVLHPIRSFKTAPAPSDNHYFPMTFGIIGDIGQFEHSEETLEHMKNNMQGIQAVVLVGDIAYPGMDGRRWDTFFDFLDDHSNFDTVPLQVAAGNHGTLGKAEKAQRMRYGAVLTPFIFSSPFVYRY